MAARDQTITAGAEPPVPAVNRDAWSPIVGSWTGVALMAPLIILLVALVGYPLLKLTIDSLTLGNGFGNYTSALGSATFRKVLITTVVASLVVTALAIVLGATLAWYIRVVENRVARVILWLAVLLPVLMGTVMKNYAFVIIFSNEGPLNKVLEVLGFGSTELLYTTTAVIIGMVYTMIPYAVLAMYSVFANFDLALVTAARSMGASRPRTMTTVVLPQAAPGLIATGAIVFAISLGFYVTPVLLGGAQTPFMALLVQENILQSFNYPLASTAAVLLLVTAVVVMAVTLGLVGTRRLMQTFT